MNQSQFDTIKHLRFKAKLSKASLKLLKEQVLRMLRDQEKDQLFQMFMEWTPKKGEIMLYTDYCVHGFNLPATFNSMMQTNIPEVISTRAYIPFAVINGWAAINEIAMGHRHVCLLQFEESVPDIITNLPELNDNVLEVDRDIILFNQTLT